MNFWCFPVEVFNYTENLFTSFLDAYMNVPKSEFFIPIVADEFIKEGKGVVRVIGTSASWFGVTYKEDAPSVQASIDTLIQGGEYPAQLWA
jgi:hypothetical protein